ncbi:MAG: hypothetical protein V3575_03720 [Candidatus Absconditabacteria bacterium]
MSKDTFNFSKIIVYVVLFGILGSIMYLAFIVYNKNMKSIQQKIKDDSSISYIVSYLNNNFQGNYPYPQGDLILMDKNFNQIHLEDRSIPLSNIPDLYIIQGNVCNIGVSDETFLSRGVDEKFSVGENKRCYSYSVTKDRQVFQIGKIDYVNFEHVASLLGNSEVSITRDFQSMNLVENGGKHFLPYPPYKNNKFTIKLLKGDYESLKFFENDLEMNYDLSSINDGVVFPQEDIGEKVRIEVNGKDFILQITDPKGNLVTLSPDDEGSAVTEISNFDFAGNKTDVDFVNMVGKYVFNLTKMSDSSNYTVSEMNGGVLVIRGTKFVLDVSPKYSYTYLGQGKIEYKAAGNSFELNKDISAIGFDSNRQLVNLFTMNNDLGRLYGYSVAMDSLIKLPVSFNLNPESSIAEKNQLLKDKLGMINIGTYNINEYGDFYKLSVFSGSFAPSLAVDLVTNREYITDILNSYCDSSLLDLTDAYKFINYLGTSKNDEGKDKLQFALNSGLLSVVNGKYLIPFNNSDERAKAQNTNLTSFNNHTGDISFKNISSNNENDKIDGMILICK